MLRSNNLYKLKAILAGLIFCVVYILIQNGALFEEKNHVIGGQQSRLRTGFLFEKLDTRPPEKFAGKVPLIFLQTKKIHSSLMYNEPCELTRDPAKFAESNAVVFHGKDLPLPENFIKLRSKPLLAGQLWVYFNLESPKNTKKVPSNEMLFNLTVTPQQNSDIVHPYGYHSKTMESWPKKVDIKSKTGFVVWCVSNCAVRFRNDFVHLMQRYARVDVFGKCSRDFGPVRICDHNTEECEQYLSRYKFYLAFENSLCTDYVTEKYWGALHRGNVPVVMTANVDTLIPGSFIDATKFETVQKLVIYLNYLHKHDEEYLKYFAWREKYEIDYELGDARRADVWLPQLCNFLLDMDWSQRRIVNISKFYSVEENCPKKKENEIIKIIERGV